MDTTNPLYGIFSTVKSKLKEQGYYSTAIDPKSYHALKKELEKEMKLPVVSKTSLNNFMKDPYGYRWKQLNDVEEYSEAMRKGSLIDCMTLTPEQAGNSYIIEDVNRRTNAGKARVAELAERGIEVVSHAEYDAAQRIAGIAQKELASRLGEYQTQIACWATIDNILGEKLETPVILTGMFDILPTDSSLPIVDLKTTSRSIVNPSDVNRNMAEYGYGIQAAVYMDLSLLALEENRGFSFFYVSLDEPTRMRWVGTKGSDIELYRARYFDAMIRYAKAWAHDDWGTPLLPDMIYEMPAWDARKDKEDK